MAILVIMNQRWNHSWYKSALFMSQKSYSGIEPYIAKILCWFRAALFCWSERVKMLKSPISIQCQHCIIVYHFVVWLLMLFVGGSWTIWVFGLKWWRRDPGTQIKLLPFFSSVPVAAILDFKMAAIFSIFWPTSQLLSYLESSKWWQNLCFW